MFPDPDHTPAARDERLVVAAVAGNIDRKLGSPPFPVRTWKVSVLRARVPEASVDEHGHSRTREHDVGAAADAGSRLMVDAKPESRDGVVRAGERPPAPCPVRRLARMVALAAGDDGGGESRGRTARLRMPRSRGSMSGSPHKVLAA